MGGSKDEKALLRTLSQIMQQKFKGDSAPPPLATRKSPEAFSSFFCRHFSNRLGLPALARKHQKEFVLSLAAHAGTHKRLAMFLVLLGLDRPAESSMQVSEECVSTYIAILHDLSGFSPVTTTVELITLMRVVSTHCTFLGEEQLQGLEKEVADLCSLTPFDPCSGSDTVLLDAALELTVNCVHAHDLHCCNVPGEGPYCS
jgi:hypothetical protein